MSKAILILFLALGMSSLVEAVPAYRGAIKARQPDGTIITIFMRGDEHGHECVSIDGYRLVQDRNGIYRYATQDSDGNMTFDKAMIAHDPKERTFAERNMLSELKVAKRYIIPSQKTPSKVNANASANAKASKASHYQIGTFPTNGKGKCLVLLVQFSDNKFSFDREYHKRMLNEPGFSDDGATGSARDYYFDQSSGMFEPQFDVFGPITLSHGMSYYGSDDYIQGKDVNVAKMVTEACSAADGGVDFTEYDGDGDGKVDMVYIIYAGYGQHAGGGDNTIWPHKYQLSASGNSITLDGKTVDVYACSSELAGNSGEKSSGIGTICHEFGHVLGLADHYNTTASSTYVLGRYDIMDYGSYNNDGRTPPAYNAFERMTLGWMTPDTLDSKANGAELEHIASSNKAYLISTSNSDEFYLLENRQQEGWDSYIPGSGMMMTHVDYDATVWNGNTLNDDPSHLHYNLIAADNEPGYNEVLQKETERYDLYPCTGGSNAGNDRFTDTSSPAAKPWTGEILDKWVTDISNDNGIVSFNFMENHLQTPQDISAMSKGDGTLEITWQPVENALSYNIALYRLIPTSEHEEALTEDFSLMTAGDVDKADSKNISDVLDSYTYKRGWTGSNVYQAGGWCQIGKGSQGGTLNTPKLNMRHYDGEYAVLVTAKSVSGKQPVLSVESNGQTGKTRITSSARTYAFKFKGGMNETPIAISTNSERGLKDNVTVVRGHEPSLPDGAKDVDVSGEPEINESGDIEENDFIHTDNKSVTGITEPAYTFNDLNAGTYYSFTIQAVGDGAESVPSAEYRIFTGETSGIERPKTMPDNSKKEIFTIGGRRVGSMEMKGIYIIRQGNKTMKAIKNN